MYHLEVKVIIMRNLSYQNLTIKKIRNEVMVEQDKLELNSVGQLIFYAMKTELTYSVEKN